jgi:hypothetical protein
MDNLRGKFAVFLRVVSAHAETINDNMQICGVGVEIEADELAFRSQDGEEEDGTPFVFWLRYIAVCKRGSSTMFLHALPTRKVKGAGQGGGGSLGLEEFVEVVRPTSDRPLFAHGSIVHTDSAKAYKWLGPLRWPSNGVLQDNKQPLA